MADPIAELHASLDRRPTPESVVALIVAILGSTLTVPQRRSMSRAAQSRPAWYSSMSDDFERPVAAVHKVRTLLRLFEVEVPDDVIERMAADPWLLEGQLAFLAPYLGFMGAGFSGDLNRQQRADNGVQFSHRKYRRLVRQLRRTAAQSWRLKEQVLLRQMVVVGRSGLAYSITEKEMRADPDAACFVAYWVVRKNVRRQFTLEDRGNPFDAVADLLFARCLARSDTDWWMIARAFPRPEVLARITEQQRGELMARWMDFMRLAAARLHDLHDAWPNNVDDADMIVRQGVDSSTWNTVAQAYNAARAGWLACVDAIGANRLLNVMCPGKAMRLMAGDLAGWHRDSGSGIDPQTAVWAMLPRPWDVLAERIPCTARTVELACNQAGVDPRATGWTAPAKTTEVADWKPTPELVHGVEISDPLWAGLLRRAGAFSGKPVKGLHVVPAGDAS